MLTCLNSAPTARSAATVCAENPHCGKSGVPFMNSTTGLELSSALIFSTTSIVHSWKAIGAARVAHCPRKLLRSPALTHTPANLQLGNELPLLRGAHGDPAADLGPGAQASSTKALCVQCTDLDA